ncbi:hypothetical protein Poly59_17480 [Rubripirellula reticaptiva]|uniref:Uncharacterized protein n=1 Tax=Rubripirellula reticaptiva TaxID=2528013 RepID=A0A5C6F6J9_9BACT|nr:hypothetical protein Poly59_17480 [Rubripirellula reticaptiva]
MQTCFYDRVISLSSKNRLVSIVSLLTHVAGTLKLLATRDPSISGQCILSAVVAGISRFFMR